MRRRKPERLDPPDVQLRIAATYTLRETHAGVAVYRKPRKGDFTLCANWTPHNGLQQSEQLGPLAVAEVSAACARMWVSRKRARK